MSSIEVDLHLILHQLDVDRGVVPVKCMGYLEKALVDIGSLIYVTVRFFTNHLYLKLRMNEYSICIVVLVY